MCWTRTSSTCSSQIFLINTTSWWLKCVAALAAALVKQRN
ncbi:phage integrase family domain protein [Synechococcus sp. RS9915]|nr:phage integrase family domain protein [Synechococcus sp. RS9915]